MVELGNIHDEAQAIEPIHRLAKNVDVNKRLDILQNEWSTPDGHPVFWKAGNEEGVICLDRTISPLPIGVLQTFLDKYLSENPGELDYIHGKEDLLQLASEQDSIGFLLPAIEKSDLFRGVIADGVLPRKTFSMGHAREKRYYWEGRKIL